MKPLKLLSVQAYLAQCATLTLQSVTTFTYLFLNKLSVSVYYGSDENSVEGQPMVDGDCSQYCLIATACAFQSLGPHP